MLVMTALGEGFGLPDVETVGLTFVLGFAGGLELHVCSVDDQKLWIN